jgi:hypothetical protein
MPITYSSVELHTFAWISLVSRIANKQFRAKNVAMLSGATALLEVQVSPRATSIVQLRSGLCSFAATRQFLLVLGLRPT